MQVNGHFRLPPCEATGILDRLMGGDRDLISLMPGDRDSTSPHAGRLAFGPARIVDSLIRVDREFRSPCGLIATGVLDHQDREVKSPHPIIFCPVALPAHICRGAILCAPVALRAKRTDVQPGFTHATTSAIP